MAKILSPPLFLGELDSSDDLDDYLVTFDNVAICNGWNDVVKKAAFCACLRNRAQYLLSQIPNTAAMTYAQLRDAFYAAHNPQHVQAIRRTQLQNRVQNSCESVSDYAKAISGLGSKAYAQMNADSKDLILTDLFIRGLKPSIRRWVMADRPRNLAAAILSAEQQEALHAIDAGAENVPGKSCINTNSISVTKSDREVELEMRIAELEEQLADYEVGNESDYDDENDDDDDDYNGGDDYDEQ